MYFKISVPAFRIDLLEVIIHLLRHPTFTLVNLLYFSWQVALITFSFEPITGRQSKSVFASNRVLDKKSTKQGSLDEGPSTLLKF